MTWSLYVLRSLSGRYYIGSTKNIKRRLAEHNSGKNISTRKGIPWKIVFVQNFESLFLAKRAESKIKSYKSKKIIEKIIQDGFFLKG